MKLIAVSDLHIDEPEKEKLGWRTIENIIQEKADALLVGGDIACTKKVLRKALKELSKFKGEKLAYLGNHEMRALETSSFLNYAEEMAPLFARYGFKLLDHKPVVIGNIGFAGNVGWFDFSLYSAGIPEDIEKAMHYHYSRHKTGGVSAAEFTGQCIQKINRDISEIESKCDKICIGFHHIGFREFLLYGSSRQFDYKNALMGSEKLRKVYSSPKAAIGFCGHNHRAGKLNEANCKVYNISMEAKQPYYVMEIR